MGNKRKRRLFAEQIMVLGFAAVIFLGGCLLALPVSSADGQAAPFLDALFTSATSVCVTGLVTVTTAAQWSVFGKCVILLLIQFGGLGVMACMMLVFLIMHRKISLRNRTLIQDTYSLPDLGGSVEAVRRLLIGTFAVEAAGAVCYSFSFVPEFGWAKGLAFSVFHAVSAFCNAGIDILGSSSLAEYVRDPLINLTTMTLIILSGLGFPVWWEILGRVRGLVKRKFGRKQFFRGFTLHAKLVLIMTASLVIGGTLLILLLDWNHPGSLRELAPGEKVMAALFQSVTTRTAGFETIPQKNFSDGSAMVCLMLMFVGGSPMGTAGGVKTTTIAIVILMIAAYIRGRERTEAFGRSVSEENLRTAVVVFFFAFGVGLAATVALVAATGAPLLDCGYEIISAIATVGLTRSLTPTLPAVGKVIVIAVMFMGRIGPITLAIALARRSRGRKASRTFPEQQILMS